MPQGPMAMPAVKNPMTGEILSLRKSGTTTPAAARNKSPSLKNEVGKFSVKGVAPLEDMCESLLGDLQPDHLGRLGGGRQRGQRSGPPDIRPAMTSIAGLWDLESTRGDRADRAADMATRDLPPERRDRAYRDLIARLDAPESLAIEQNGSAEREGLSEALRSVSSAPGEVILPGEWEKAVALIAEGTEINYEGASSKLDFDQYGDVSPDFGVYIIEKGQLVRRDVVAIPADYRP